MIRNVVFDVGNVLVKLHYQPFVGYLVKSGVDMSDMQGWLKTVDLEGHERGDVPGEVLLARIAGMAAHPLDPAELRTQWLSMFERWDEMFVLASGLMSGLPRVPAVQYRGHALDAPGFAVRPRFAGARRLRVVPRRRDQAACGHLPQGRS